MNLRLIRPLFFAFTILGFSLLNEGQAAPGEGASPAHSAIVAKLKEIVALRETMDEAAKLAAQENRGNGDGATGIALAQARVDLARELHQQEVVIAELKKIVAIRQARYERAVAMVTRSQTQLSVSEAQIELLKAQIELAREEGR